MPKVSVLMPAFNYGRYLRHAIESVLAQTHSDLELIIADDCSSDGSREIAEEWKRRDGRVIIVSHDVNRGVAGARNSGLGVSSGEFIAFCDADDIWLPHKLKTQLEQMLKRPEVGLVYSDTLIMDNEGALTGQLFSVLYHRRGQEKSGNLFQELCVRNFLCTSTVILRREAIEYAGGFNPKIKSLEDWLCWTKISRKYPFYYVDEPLIQYRVHSDSLTHNPTGMATNRVRALRTFLAEVPDTPAKYQSTLLYDIAMSHVELGDSRNALVAFKESIGTDKLNIRSWVRYFQTVVKLPLSRSS